MQSYESFISAANLALLGGLIFKAGSLVGKVNRMAQEIAELEKKVTRLELEAATFRGVVGQRKLPRITAPDDSR